MKPAVPVILTLVVAASASMQAFAQDTTCPAVTIASAAEANSPDAAEFKVSVQGGGAGVDALYNWQVSAGAIVSGQGTPDILVATDGIPAGEVIKAMIEVLGYPASCDTTASASVTVVRKARQIFEGAYTDDAALGRLLDALIGRRPLDGKCYVVFYAGRAAPAAELAKLKETAKAHLEMQGENPENYPFMDGGPRDQTTIEFWLAGPDAEAPKLGTAN